MYHIYCLILIIYIKYFYANAKKGKVIKIVKPQNYSSAIKRDHIYSHICRTWDTTNYSTNSNVLE